MKIISHITNSFTKLAEFKLTFRSANPNTAFQSNDTQRVVIDEILFDSIPPFRAFGELDCSSLIFGNDERGHGEYRAIVSPWLSPVSSRVCALLLAWAA